MNQRASDRVLVTGVGGLIGAAVARRLTVDGHFVVGMDRSVPERFPLPFMSHDLPDPHRWHQAIVEHRINKVVHAGGVSGPMLLNDAPNRIVQINLDGLTGLLEVARIHRLERVVCFSSVVAYGDHPDLAPVTEKAWLNPASVYGATKAAGDALISAYYQAYGVDVVSFRVAGCYGPGRVTPCLVRMMIENALEGKESIVCEDPRRTRQFIYVDDVVQAVCQVLTAASLKHRTYNIGPGKCHSAQDVIDAVQSVLPDARATIDPAGMRWNSFGVGLLEIDSAKQDFGFNPSVDLDLGAARTLEWVKQRQHRE